MRARWLVIAVLAACGHPSPKHGSPGVRAAPDPARASEAQCTQLLVHRIDLELAATAAPPQGADSATQKQQLIDQRRAKFMAACTSASIERVNCGLAAQDLVTAMACGPDEASPATSASVQAALASSMTCDADADCVITQDCCPATTCGGGPRAATLTEAKREQELCAVATCEASKPDARCARLDPAAFKAVCTDHRCTRAPR